MPITPEDIKRLLADRHWSQNELTRRLGAGNGAVSNWILGKRSPTGLYERELERLIAETAIQGAGGASSEELRSMVNRIVGATTRNPDEVADPLERERLRGRREATTEILSMLVESLLASAHRDYGQNETQHTQETHTDGTDRRRAE